jgi:hypothetical protein
MLAAMGPFVAGLPWPYTPNLPLCVHIYTPPLTLRGHGGTFVRILTGLSNTPVRWPSFGSEIVVEVLYARCVRG